MNLYPTEPSIGDKISATIIRDIILCLRRITPMAGQGTTLRVTPNGTFISSAGGTTSVSSSSSKNDCWKIGTETYGFSDVKAFVNRFYAVGGNMYEMGMTNLCSLNTWINQGELSDGEEYTAEDKPFVFLCVTMEGSSAGTATVDATKTLAEMMAECSKADRFVKPLYKLTHDGCVAIDFRNMPLVSSYETTSQQEVIG